MGLSKQDSIAKYGTEPKTPWNKGLKMKSSCVVCSILIDFDKWGSPKKTCGPKCLTLLRSQVGKVKNNPPSRLGARILTAKHKHITSQGYVELHEGNSPALRILEHRYIMEQQLGRKLTSQEHVHHMDGNKQNNSINNLMLFPNASEHSKYHIRYRFRRIN